MVGSVCVLVVVSVSAAWRNPNTDCNTDCNTDGNEIMRQQMPFGPGYLLCDVGVPLPYVSLSHSTYYMVVYLCLGMIL